MNFLQEIYAGNSKANGGNGFDFYVSIHLHFMVNLRHLRSLNFLPLLVGEFHVKFHQHAGTIVLVEIQRMRCGAWQWKQSAS